MNARAPRSSSPPDADYAGPVFTAGNRATPRDLLFSATLLAGMATLYLTAVVAAAHASLAFEAAIGLGLPLAVVWARQVRFPHPRLLELVWIESAFNALAVTAKLAHAADLPGLDVTCGAAFAVWFAVQLGGFVRSHLRAGCPYGTWMGLLAVVLIGWWFVTAPSLRSTVDDGRLLIWGAEAPLAVRLGYVLWVVNLTVNATKALPLVRLTIVQWASIGVALASGAFFHTRLMTACHLFVLDLVFVYTAWPVVLGERFAVLPASWHDRVQAARPAIGRACCVVGTALVVGAMLAG